MTRTRVEGPVKGLGYATATDFDARPMHHFGSEVRWAREAAGMAQSDIGELVPCDKGTVSRTEAGLTAPDEAIARACDAAFPAMS